MKKKTHIQFAALLVLIFILTLGYFNIELFKFDISSIFIMILLTVFYSILPDIDHKNSAITWLFFGIGVLGLVIGILELIFKFNLVSPIIILILSTLLLSSTYIAGNIFSHRGFIHSIPVGILAVTPLYFLFHGMSYCYLAYVAWHSHLLGDGYLLKFK